MVRLIDRVGAEQRHHDRLHQKFERNAESNADGRCAGPALWPHVADFAPLSARRPDPYNHQHGAEGRNDQVTREDDENRDDSEQPKSAQASGERISRRRFSSRFDGGRNNVLRQIRRVACHADQYAISETKFRSSI